jgi:hypothetical protein
VTHDNWRAASVDIAKAMEPATTIQHKIATLAGVKLQRNLPQLVAAARLQSALGTEIGAPEVSEVREMQEEIIRDLSTRSLRVVPKPQDSREAEAWITYLRLKRRQKAIEKLQLSAGDIVEVKGNDGQQIAEVSSVGGDGRIHLKGGGGAGAWPDLITVLCRKDDDSRRARDLKRKAANQIALRARAESWSLNKQRELEDFEITAPLTEEHVEQLQEVIDSANDEKPIQQFLEAYPQTLTAILTGRSRFLIPRPSLAGKHIPDFLISDFDSLGIRWLLVELETPQSPITMRRHNDLEANARRGVSQVREWREWLQNHLDMARRSKREGGQGLVDIRPQSEGLVLVGRRTLLHQNSSAIRNRIIEENQIHVHTYDWLLEALRGTLLHSGPPALNPYAIRAPRTQRSKWAKQFLGEVDLSDQG